jgi:PHP family Zn ribbon phosphoesterase
LTKIIAEAKRVGEGTKKVQRCYDQLLAVHGPELSILREIPLSALAETAGARVAEGIRRVREGLLKVTPGYDGVYGAVEIF